MKNDVDIDWLAVSQQGASDRAVDRLQRVVSFFDRLNLTAESELPGKFWCDLEVHEPLASGGFGTLYRAYDPHLRREVALKLLDLNTPGASDWLEEARRLARVRHPGVIAILGASSDDHHAGIWMELSNGGPLESLMTASGLNQLDQVLETGLSIAEALMAVHERGLVHGDLKAGNVLIEPSGRVLLLDFGAATAQGEPVNQASPRTAAPEQLTGQQADPAADIWSLGALLYRCLSGQQPYQATDLNALVAAQRKPPDLGLLPPLFRSLIGQMLSFDPAQRPDAEQVGERLRWIRNAPNRWRKNLALSSIVASLLIGITIASIGWYEAAESSTREQLAATQAEVARNQALHSAEEARASLQIFQDVIGASFQGTHGQDARVIDVLEQSQRQLALDDSKPPYVRAMVQFVVGASYLDLGRTEEGMRLLDESIALLPADDVAIATVRASQGLNICNEDAQRAEALAAEIRESAINRLANDHHVFADALKIEACAAQRRGDDVLAEQKLREAMAIRPIERFPDRGALGTVARLAAVLIDQRRIAEALPLLEATRARSLELLGPQHDFTLSLTNVFSQALLESSRFAEAVVLLEETLAAVESRSGPTSSQWITNASTLASALSRSGEPARALALNARALATAREQLGHSHRFTLSIMSSRGVYLKELGRLDDAEQAIAQAALAVESALGSDHPMALLNHINRVEALALLGRAAQAVALGRQTLAISLNVMGAEHGFTASAQAYLAQALVLSGELSEAEVMFVQALDFQDTNNPDSLHTFETRYRYAAMLTDLGRISDMRRELSALQLAFDNLAHDHPLLQKIEELRERAAQ